MSLRLGKRCLSPEEYEYQRSRGIGTMAAQFRLGPRVLNKAAATAATDEDAEPKTKAPKTKKRRRRRATAK